MLTRWVDTRQSDYWNGDPNEGGEVVSEREGSLTWVTVSVVTLIWVEGRGRVRTPGAPVYGSVGTLFFDPPEVLD